VYLQDNLLDLSEGSKAMTDIRTLISRGVSVRYLPEASVAVLAIVAFTVMMVAARPRCT